MLAYIFVLMAVAMRMPFVPHPWGFTPAAAALLYFGARGAKRQMWVPVVLLAASDVILTRLVYNYPFAWDHFVTWAWYGAILWLGTSLRKNARPLPVVGAALASSVSFFVISNFAVWAAWEMYPKTLAGLMTCYIEALPFFRRGVEGDLTFTVAMFGLPVAIQAIARATERGRREAAV
jgi:hypothetical protein